MINWWNIGFWWILGSPFLGPKHGFKTHLCVCGPFSVDIQGHIIVMSSSSIPGFWATYCNTFWEFGCMVVPLSLCRKATGMLWSQTVFRLRIRHFSGTKQRGWGVSDDGFKWLWLERDILGEPPVWPEARHTFWILLVGFFICADVGFSIPVQQIGCTASFSGALAQQDLSQPDTANMAKKQHQGGIYIQETIWNHNIWW